MLKEALGIFQYYPEQEVLHNIRVDIKRIRTVFRLIRYSNEDFSIRKNYMELKGIFKHAGSIREKDLLINMFSVFEISDAGEKKMLEENDVSTYEFRKNVNRFQKEVKDTYLRTKDNLSRIRKENLAEYQFVKQLELQKIISPICDKSELHETRKVIKEIIYLSQIMHGSKDMMELIYDNIQNKIGKWHDKLVLLNYLKENYADSHKKNIDILLRSMRSNVGNLKNMIKAIQNKEFIQAM